MCCSDKKWQYFFFFVQLIEKLKKLCFAVAKKQTETRPHQGNEAPAIFTSYYYLKLNGRHFRKPHCRNGVVNQLLDLKKSLIGNIFATVKTKISLLFSVTLSNSAETKTNQMAKSFVKVKFDKEFLSLISLNKEV